VLSKIKHLPLKIFKNSIFTFQKLPVTKQFFLRLLISTLCIIVGATFIFSAISKIPTLEQFGWTIVETTFLHWTAAEWSARILIGLELFLGVLFIAHFRIRKLAIPISLFLLSVFSIYLLLVIRRYGSDGNCGCFGDVIKMTPLESVIKNIVLIVLIFIIQWGSSYEWNHKFGNWLIVCFLLLCLATPIYLSPPESIYISEKEKEINQPIPLSLLYTSSNNVKPATELRKGKHIIAFMSLTCGFCRKAAKRMRIMKEKHPELPFYIILNGDKENLQDFLLDTKATNIDHSLFNGVVQFTLLNRGTALPTIKWVQDTTLLKESNYMTLDENEILKWIKKQ